MGQAHFWFFSVTQIELNTGTNSWISKRQIFTTVVTDKISVER
jgi:hypothetical protein